jgi:hypothetical protein
MDHNPTQNGLVGKESGLFFETDSDVYLKNARGNREVNYHGAWHGTEDIVNRLSRGRFYD